MRTIETRLGGRAAAGFTLVEMLVTVAIASILMAIAVPSYRQYVQRSNRTDATTALMSIASAQEKFYMQNNTYASEAQRAAAPPAGLGIPQTSQDLYQLTITPNPALVTGYTVTAVARAAGGQGTDSACQTFTINERGVRTALNSSNADNTTTCWR